MSFYYHGASFHTCTYKHLKILLLLDYGFRSIYPNNANYILSDVDISKFHFVNLQTFQIKF